MKACIIGAGSIGLKHAKNLSSEGIEVCFVSRRTSIEGVIFPLFKSIQDALSKFKPDLIWICSETSKHANDLIELDNYKYEKQILIEKPSFDKSSVAPQFKFLKESQIRITYNLRLLESLNFIKTDIAAQKVLSASIYVGQHLSTWRPGRKWQEDYSADSSRGGGVLRDLSHELDYACWLFGQPSKVSSLIKNFQSLNIKSEESAKILFSTSEGVNVTVELNYLDHQPRRFLLIHTTENSYWLDFMKGTLEKNSQVIMKESFISETYKTQAKKILSNDFDNFCSYDEALSVVKFIEKIEKSNLNNN